MVCTGYGLFCRIFCVWVTSGFLLGLCLVNLVCVSFLFVVSFMLLRFVSCYLQVYVWLIAF